MSTRVPSLNSTDIAGRLVRDPEMKSIGDKSLAKITVANTEFYTSNGERKESTVFVDVNIWGKQADFVNSNLKKGSPVIVSGKLKSDTWVDKESGKNRTSFFIEAKEIHMLEWPEQSQDQAQPQTRQNYSQNSRPQSNNYNNKPQYQRQEHNSDLDERYSQI